MAAFTIKEVLHQTIEEIEDNSILYAAYTLLQKSISQHSDPTEEQPQILNGRAETYLSGKSTSYSLEELKELMYKKYGF